MNTKIDDVINSLSEHYALKLNGLKRDNEELPVRTVDVKLEIFETWNDLELQSFVNSFYAAVIEQMTVYDDYIHQPVVTIVRKNAQGDTVGTHQLN